MEFEFQNLGIFQILVQQRISFFLILTKSQRNSITTYDTKIPKFINILIPDIHPKTCILVIGSDLPGILRDDIG